MGVGGVSLAAEAVCWTPFPTMDIEPEAFTTTEEIYNKYMNKSMNGMKRHRRRCCDLGHLVFSARAKRRDKQPEITSA